MRNGSTWLGGLALMVLVGCATSAPTATPTAAAAPVKAVTAGCNGTACTVLLIQTGDQCSVDPPSLAIANDNTVTFVAQFDASVVVITPKPGPPSGITFQNGPPGRIDRGREHPAGKATGAQGARYNYGAQFVGSGGPVCTVDPVICIKGGGMQDTCDTN